MNAPATRSANNEFPHDPTVPVGQESTREMSASIDPEFAKAEGINESRISNIWAVNRSIRSELVEGHGIPDSRAGSNMLANTTLARKHGDTEQLMKWGAIQPDAHYIIIRPTNMTGNEGGAYVIPRTAIKQPYRSASSAGRKI